MGCSKVVLRRVAICCCWRVGNEDVACLSLLMLSMSASLKASDKELLGGGMGDDLLEMGGDSEMGN